MGGRGGGVINRNAQYIPLRRGEVFYFNSGTEVVITIYRSENFMETRMTTSLCDLYKADKKKRKEY